MRRFKKLQTIFLFILPDSSRQLNCQAFSGFYRKISNLCIREASIFYHLFCNLDCLLFRSRKLTFSPEIINCTCHQLTTPSPPSYLLFVSVYWSYHKTRSVFQPAGGHAGFWKFPSASPVSEVLSCLIF